MNVDVKELIETLIDNTKTMISLDGYTIGWGLTEKIERNKKIIESATGKFWNEMEE